MTKLDAFNLLAGIANLGFYTFGSGYTLNLVAGILCLTSVAICAALTRY